MSLCHAVQARCDLHMASTRGHAYKSPFCCPVAALLPDSADPLAAAVAAFPGRISASAVPSTSVSPLAELRHRVWKVTLLPLQRSTVSCAVTASPTWQQREGPRAAGRGARGCSTRWGHSVP